MYIETILSYVSESFNFAYIISINIAVYFILYGITYFIKKEVKKPYKILITIITTIVFGIVYHFLTDISNEQLINSSIIAPISWDWIIKPILQKFKIDYKDVNF